MTSLRALIDQATPGPWRLGKTWGTIQGTRMQTVEGADARELGHSWFRQEDARLIAAAPTIADLLDRMAVELQVWSGLVGTHTLHENDHAVSRPLLAEFSVLLASLQPGEPQ